MQGVTIQAGETLTAIAVRFGFADYRVIWDHPDNAELRKARPAPHLLRPGDVVQVPPLAVKEVPKPAAAEHQFKVKIAHVGKVRFIDDGGVPATNAPTVLTRLSVSNLVTNVQLPPGYLTASTDRDNFKIEVEDAGVAGDTIPAAKVVVKSLKPGLTHTIVAGDSLSAIAKKYGLADYKLIYDHEKNNLFKTANPDPAKIPVGEKLWVPTPHYPRRFSPAREIQVELKRVAGTNLFRSRYLRLVVDDVDQAAVPGQTVLVDWDSTDEHLDILGQVIRVKYTSSSTEVVSADVTVGGATRSFMRVGVHVVRSAPGGAGVVTVKNAKDRVLKWFRRTYAQIDIAPILTVVREVDPLENLVSVSDEVGTNATGGVASMMVFSVTATRTGGAAPATVPVVHRPPAGATPGQTAAALAAIINASGSLTARVVQNPPTLEAAVLQGSADVIITDTAGGRITIAGTVSTDATQTLKVGRVNTAVLRGWGAPGDNNNWVVGSIQQRTLLQAYDQGADRVELFVVGTFVTGERGQAMIPGAFYAAGKQALAQVRRSAFVIQTVMDGTPNNPFSAPHETGHVMIDAIHATVATELMTNGGTSAANAVGGSKRYSATAVLYDSPAINITQETRLRANGAAALKPFS